MTIKNIPVTALTGFLGSGKTTLLNHILTHDHGLKIGVVVNDYGDINIDAQIVAGETDTTLELTNGCICCSMDSLDLDEAIGQFAYPGSPIDYIIIEASGLAEPADLASTLRQAMNPRTRLDSVVAVLDAPGLDYSPDAKSISTQQIEHSDFVVINKTDLVDAARITELRSRIIAINHRARIFTTIKAELDVRLLLDQGVHETDGRQTEHNHIHTSHHHLHEEYTTVSFTGDRPLDPVAFQRFVNEQIPPNVYRAKGVVDLGPKGHDRKYLFQLVGKRLELTWTSWEGETPRTQLVFIGKGFNETKLRALVTDCIDPTPTAIDPTRRVVLPRQAH